jgi:hypothetical protein
MMTSLSTIRVSRKGKVMGVDCRNKRLRLDVRRSVCVVLSSAALLWAFSPASAQAADAPDVAGTTAQAVCQSQTFPTFASFGECVQFVIQGGAVGVRLGSLNDEQVVFYLVIQNGAIVALSGVNTSTTCQAYGTATATTGQQFTVVVGPGESNEVSIPSELGGIDIIRFQGDIPGQRIGSFGFLIESFNQFGAGTISGC